MRGFIKKWIVWTMVLVFVAGLSMPMPVYAADAEWRMMHGEQDALVIGTIAEITEEGYRVEVAQPMWCQQDTAKGRMIPLEEVPSEMIIPEIRYAYSYHMRKAPEAGDCIFISVDKKNGDIWEQNWLAMEVSSTEPDSMQFAQPEHMTSSKYAWQIFVLSGGETTSFAFDGNDILYVDGEVVFDRMEYLKELEAQEERETEVSESIVITTGEGAEVQREGEKPETEDKNLINEESSAIAVIGGADGPTAIFVAAKIGKGTIVAGVVLVAFIICAVIVGVKKFSKKK
ncbi:MAG: hypothetical protein IJ282_05465 [Lachnospiraceae bacterium]|nr:hypothetical protein [Lachnospiraceae bacterium]